MQNHWNYTICRSNMRLYFLLIRRVEMPHKTTYSVLSLLDTHILSTLSTWGFPMSKEKLERKGMMDTTVFLSLSSFSAYGWYRKVTQVRKDMIGSLVMCVSWNACFVHWKAIGFEWKMQPFRDVRAQVTHLEMKHAYLAHMTHLSFPCILQGPLEFCVMGHCRCYRWTRQWEATVDICDVDISSMYTHTPLSH